MWYTQSTGAACKPQKLKVIALTPPFSVIFFSVLLVVAKKSKYMLFLKYLIISLKLSSGYHVFQVYAHSFKVWNAVRTFKYLPFIWLWLWHCWEPQTWVSVCLPWLSVPTQLLPTDHYRPYWFYHQLGPVLDITGATFSRSSGKSLNITTTWKES